MEDNSEDNHENMTGNAEQPEDKKRTRKERIKRMTNKDNEDRIKIMSTNQYKQAHDGKQQQSFDNARNSKRENYTAKC